MKPSILNVLWLAPLAAATVAATVGGCDSREEYSVQVPQPTNTARFSVCAIAVPLGREVVFVRDTATEKEWMILRLGEQSFILSDSNRLR